jgi:hypothetical protein
VVRLLAGARPACVTSKLPSSEPLQSEPSPVESERRRPPLSSSYVIRVCALCPLTWSAFAVLHYQWDARRSSSSPFPRRGTAR